MRVTNINDKLVSYFCDGNSSNKEIKEILNSHSHINIFYGQGMNFKLAIQANNIDGLQMLIEYYTKHILNKYEVGSNDYFHAKAILNDALLEALSCSPCSDKTDAYIHKFVGYDDSADEDNLSYNNENTDSDHQTNLDAHSISDIEHHSGFDEYLLVKDNSLTVNTNQEHHDKNNTSFEQGLYTYLDRDALALHDKLLGEVV